MDAQHEVILAITPAFSVAGKGGKNRLSANYSFRGQHYTKGSKGNDAFHNASLQANSEVIKNRLTFDATANYDQRLTDLRVGLIPDYSSGSANLSNVGYYEAGLTWTQPLASLADFLARLQMFAVDQPGNNDTYGYLANLSGNSDLALNRGFWDFKYGLAYQKPRNEAFVLTHTGSANAGYAVHKHISLLLSFFFERNDIPQNTRNSDLNTASVGPGIRFMPSDSSYLDITYNFDLNGDNPDHWGARLFWQASPRTLLSGSYNKRFYGDAWNASFSHSIRRWRNQFNYGESLESFATQLLNESRVQTTSFLCPAGQSVDLNAIDLNKCELVDLNVIQPGPDQQVISISEQLTGTGSDLFLVRQGGWSTSYQGRRNTFTLALFVNDREYFSETRDERDYGGQISWSHRLGAYTSLQLSSQIRWLDNDDSGVKTTDKEQSHGLNLSHTLGKRTVLVLGYLYTNRDSAARDSAARNSAKSGFIENRVTLNLGIVF